MYHWLSYYIFMFSCFQVSLKGSTCTCRRFTEVVKFLICLIRHVVTYNYHFIVLEKSLISWSAQKCCHLLLSMFPKNRSSVGFCTWFLFSCCKKPRLIRARILSSEITQRRNTRLARCTVGTPRAARVPSSDDGSRSARGRSRTWTPDEHAQRSGSDLHLNFKVTDLSRPDLTSEFW